MMRKRLVDQAIPNVSPDVEEWLDVKRLAQVEMTSEDADFPIDAIFETGGSTSGWRAATPGPQTIRILFDEPQQIRTIHLLFKEEQQARTQEFVLRWSPDEGQPLRDIIRQQYNFSPDSTTEELETYTVHLEGVKVVELAITPDVGRGSAKASVNRFWLGREAGC